MFKNKYYKQIILSEILEINQKKISFYKVLIVGLGGLGSVSCIFLSSLGINFIYLLDDDEVDYSNLNRQIFFGFDDYKKKKSIFIKKIYII